MITTILFLVIAYLMGSFCSAIVVCKMMGLPDPRTQNSGNPGVANVLRIGGKRAAAITFFGDVLKGTIPVLLARLFQVEGFALALVGLAAFLGHLYPIFFKFKGGKGVATAFGALIALAPYASLLAIITWLIVALIFRYFSLAAIVTAIIVPIYIFVYSSASYLLPVIVMMLMIVWKHSDNIQRLLKGTERKISLSKAKK
jgi:acyl phosphate:glycerol-3-phosphate acyltransferase